MAAHCGGQSEIDAAVQAAEDAFLTYGWTSREDRATFLAEVAPQVMQTDGTATAFGNGVQSFIDTRVVRALNTPADAQPFMPVFERKAGRILVNGFPTGVEVADSMVHGGPFPASTNLCATSVGSMAIRRFVRPVCNQNIPSALLPYDLAD